jgi:ribonucleases P/MRP protein subunit RPP40
MVKELRNKSYSERLAILGLTTLEKRRTRGDLIEIHKIMTGKEGLDQQQFFQLAATGQNLRGHSRKLFKPRCTLNCRRHSFGQRAIEVWNALPSDVVNSTSVNTFKNRLDRLWDEENRCGQ